ncbi:MAG: hypothetical protein LW699_14385, partial [Pirellula sp.]|nr:hypothetical protein [Pirellula sp.]
MLHDLGFELTAAGFVSPLLASRPAIGQPTPDNASTINRERTSQADAQQAKAKKAIPTTSEPLSPMQRIQAFFTIGIDGHREMLQREPIFLQVRGGLESSKSWFGVSSNKDSS